MSDWLPLKRVFVLAIQLDVHQRKIIPGETLIFPYQLIDINALRLFKKTNLKCALPRMCKVNKTKSKDLRCVIIALK